MHDDQLQTSHLARPKRRRPGVRRWLGALAIAVGLIASSFTPGSLLRPMGDLPSGPEDLLARVGLPSGPEDLLTRLGVPLTSIESAARQLGAMSQAQAQT